MVILDLNLAEVVFNLILLYNMSSLTRHPLTNLVRSLHLLPFSVPHPFPNFFPL